MANNKMVKFDLHPFIRIWKEGESGAMIRIIWEALLRFAIRSPWRRLSDEARQVQEQEAAWQWRWLLEGEEGGGRQQAV